MSGISERIVSSVRFIGDMANLVALVGFCMLAFKLKDIALENYLSAGQLPELSVSGVESLLHNPGQAMQYWRFAVAWFSAIGAAGSAWMAALGLRWAFHFALRAVNR